MAGAVLCNVGCLVASLASPRWFSGKEPACKCRRHKRRGFKPWVGKIPWRRAWQSVPIFLPGETHGQRSLVGYSPRGHKELEMTEHALTILLASLTTSCDNQECLQTLLNACPSEGKIAPVENHCHTSPYLIF